MKASVVAPMLPDVACRMSVLITRMLASDRMHGTVRTLHLTTVQRQPGPETFLISPKHTCKSVRPSRCTTLRSSHDKYSPRSSCSSVSWLRRPTAASRPLRGLLLHMGSSWLAPSHTSSLLRWVRLVRGLASVIVLCHQQDIQTNGSEQVILFLLTPSHPANW